MKLEIKNVTCGYGSKIVVKDISISITSGEMVCLLGPNGIGKTTFFKTILGFLKIKTGEILLDGKNIFKLSPKEFAKIVAYVPQAHIPPFPFKVFDIVLMGRTAHMGQFSSPSKEDEKIAEDALKTLNISYLKNKIYTEISGGERQLVLIARAIAQQPKFLIMDEPTSNLDFGNQIRVLNHINDLVKKKGIGIIMTTHFPNHVFICGTKVIIMKKGGLAKVGKPDKIITKEELYDVYGVKINIITTGENMKMKVCVPIIS